MPGRLGSHRRRDLGVHGRFELRVVYLTTNALPSTLPEAVPPAGRSAVRLPSPAAMQHRRRDRPCGAEDTAARASATAGAAAARRRRTACEDGGATQVGGTMPTNTSQKKTPQEQAPKA